MPGSTTRSVKKSTGSLVIDIGRSLQIRSLKLSDVDSMSVAGIFFPRSR